MTELDQLIGQAAASKAEADYARVFAALDGTEVFFNITTKSVITPEGGPAAGMSTALYELKPGWKAVALFTAKDNPRLARPFAGMTWREAVQMVAGTKTANGLMIFGNGVAWIAVDKATASRLIA